MWVGAAVAVVVALFGAFAIGRSTAGATPQEATGAATTTSTLPSYGDPASRDAYVAAVGGSLPPGSTTTDDEILAAGDNLCANLEGFTNQGKDAHYAIRILWTDDLRYLDSTEMAAFGLVLSAAPEYLCPQYKPLGDDVAYWLGV
jgi:hypothetical protein